MARGLDCRSGFFTIDEGFWTANASAGNDINARNQPPASVTAAESRAVP